MNDSIQFTGYRGKVLCLASERWVKILDLVEPEALGKFRNTINDTVHLMDEAKDVFAIQRSDERLVEAQERFAEDLARGKTVLFNGVELAVKIGKEATTLSN